MDFNYRPTNRLMSPADIQAERLALQAGQQRNALQQMQMQAAQAEAQDRVRRNALMQEFQQSLPSPQMLASQQALAGGGGPTVANAARMPAIDPRLQVLHAGMKAGAVSPLDYANAAFPAPKAPERVKVGANERLVEFGGPGQQPRTLVDAAPSEPKTPASVQEYNFAREQGFTGSYEQWVKQKAAAGAARTQIDMRQPNAFNTAQGKEFSDLMGTINREAFAAPAQIRKLERMAQLLEGVDGGRLAPLGLEIASAANSLGIKMDPKLGNKEASQALAREIAAGFRVPGTGPMTDKDFENFLLQIPDLSKTAEGRKQITQTMRSAANRNIKLGALARDYVRRNGQLDNGFIEEAAQFIAENPVVGDMNNWKVMR